ncbi:MAG: hypothetical protein GF313_13155 [Caldithrix sp.]|nr:hypothetical protein [Caldithrix sp.]
MKRNILFISLVILFSVSMHAVAQKGGEIVFSKSLINPSSPNGLITEFQAGDNIYSVAYFDKTIKQLAGPRAKKSTIMEIFIYELKQPLYDYQQPSEKQLETSSLTVSGAALEKNYLSLDIIPEPNNMTAYVTSDLVYKKFGPKYDGPVKFAERFAKLDPVDHEIIVKVKSNYSVVAEGKFIIKGDDFTVYQNISTAINEAASNIKTQKTVMPESVRSDKKLE